MKVRIRKPSTWTICRIDSRWEAFRHHKLSFLDRPVERLAGSIQSLYNMTINPLREKLVGANTVKIDYWDVWSLDYTLALVIEPALTELRSVKHGSPLVDNDDVPEPLWASEEELERYRQTGEPDENFHRRFDWVLGEMIWAFGAIKNEDDYLIKTGVDRDELDAYYKRMNHGLRLFGKYYRNLWD